MMAVSLTLRLLLIITLEVAHAQQQCETSEICKLENTSAKSITSSLIPRSLTYPVSCLRMCIENAECMATTYDPETEHCELHEAYADGAPCFALSVKIGSIFSMMKLPGIPCPKVRHCKLNECLELSEYNHEYDHYSIMSGVII